MAQDSSRGSNLDTVRRHNLATVLGMVHAVGPMSRSKLTRATGLNRSTIGMLVGELTDLGLVHESVPGNNHRVGRPSPVVRASSDVVAIAVNPEVDAVTVGVVGLDGTVHRRVRYAVDQTPTAAETSTIVAAVLDGLRAELDTMHRVVGIGVAVPGLVREADGMVRLAPHLEWVEEPFAELLCDATGLGVRAANDANLGAEAELLFGVGRGVSDLVYLNGGASGIGGGVIADGHPLTGMAGYAGELGHTLVNSSGIRCHCGAIGCLETEVSRWRLLAVLGLEHADEEELDRALADADSGEVAAEVERQLDYLAIAVRNAAIVFNPELVVLGGFLGSLLATAPERFEELVAAHSMTTVESPPIARAELGSRLLIVGAAELAFGPLLADPASVARST